DGGRRPDGQSRSPEPAEHCPRARPRGAGGDDRPRGARASRRSGGGGAKRIAGRGSRVAGRGARGAGRGARVAKRGSRGARGGTRGDIRYIRAVKFSYEAFDLSGVKTYPLASRKSKAN